MHITHTRAYYHAVEAYLRKGTPIHRALTIQATHYIWRTQGDEKVRSSHAANEGRVFAWKDPPAMGHPGTDYNCRCRAEPYIEGFSEYASQILTEPIEDASEKWQNVDFALHFLFGDGRTVSLSETGHLRGIIEYYAYTLGTFTSINQQIIDTARIKGSGFVEYKFDRAYAFKPYLFSIGGAVVRGNFYGFVTPCHGDMLHIQGDIVYKFHDLFTDTADIRERISGTSDLTSSTIWNIISDGGGTHFDIIGSWSTYFEAEVKQDNNTSSYQKSPA